jgi:release factor glutamine methyltransferase
VFYRAIAGGAARRLLPGGWLILEVGSDQAAAVSVLLARPEFGPAQLHRDLGGHARCVAVRTRN